jgi:D-inositol-3-phosphate glycosyltransferase
MSVSRVAMFSVHTSPLAQPGTGDGGGMNVYVRSLASALARAGVGCDVLTRAEHAEQPPVVEVEPGFRVVHIEAGPRVPISKPEQLSLAGALAEGAARWLTGTDRAVDVLHANYWVSGAVAHQLKHELGLPLVATFHTLARVKADAGIDDDPVERARVELDVVRCSDTVVAATEEERRQLVDAHDGDPDRIEIIPPGVDHNVFSPGDRVTARRRLRLGADPVLLFVGRIQRLKGADLAVRCLAELDDPRARLVIVGGPSGADGYQELERLHRLTDDLGLGTRVHFEPPHAHEDLAAFYRAADVVLVPSHTESFGLVALEAAACGVPVVAAEVGGLRAIVADGETGFLVASREPAAYAAPVQHLLDDPGLAAMIGQRAASASRRYTWHIAAARLRRLYADLSVRELVQCT